MSLYFQLLKNHTSLEHVKDMNDVFSNILSGRNVDMEIWGLKPNEDFPWYPEDSKHTYLGFICLSKDEGRDDIRFVEFYHENKGCEGIILPFLDILSSKLNSKDNEIHVKNVITIPRTISKQDRDVWAQYLQKYFTDIESGEKFISKYKIPSDISWYELRNTLPVNSNDY